MVRALSGQASSRSAQTPYYQSHSFAPLLNSNLGSPHLSTAASECYRLALLPAKNPNMPKRRVSDHSEEFLHSSPSKRVRWNKADGAQTAPLPAAPLKSSKRPPPEASDKDQSHAQKRCRTDDGLESHGRLHVRSPSPWPSRKVELEVNLRKKAQWKS